MSVRNRFEIKPNAKLPNVIRQLRERCRESALSGKKMEKQK